MKVTKKKVAIINNILVLKDSNFNKIKNSIHLIKIYIMFQLNFYEFAYTYIECD